MKLKDLPPIPFFVYGVGVLLVVAGAILWWYQNEVLQGLDDPTGHVGLAVAATQPRTAIPLTPTPSPSPTASVTFTPSPTIEATQSLSDSVVARTAAVTPTFTPEPTLTPTPHPFPPSLTPPMRLVIPAITLDTAIVSMAWEAQADDSGSVFTEWAVPEREAGWHVNSAMPGHGSNVVVSGHHNVGTEVFRYLEYLEPGYEVLLYADNHEYRYVVEEKYILREADMPLEVRQQNNTYIMPSEDERLTLVSCWPYETNSHRIVIIARPAITGG